MKYSNLKIPKVTIKHVLDFFVNLRRNALNEFRVANIDPQDDILPNQKDFKDCSNFFDVFWRVLGDVLICYSDVGEYMPLRIGDEMLLSHFWP